MGTAAHVDAPEGVEVQTWITDEPSERGVDGIEPDVIVTFAMDTNRPSNDSGLAFRAAIVIRAGAGAGPPARTVTPYGEVTLSTDSVTSMRRRPPKKPIRPTALTV